MSIGLDILQEGFSVRLDLYGETLTHLATGNRFVAIVEPLPAADPRLELGGDPREMSIIHALKTALPAEMTAANAGSEHQLSSGSYKWKTVKRDDNPADFTVKFWAVKVTTQDQ